MMKDKSRFTTNVNMLFYFSKIGNQYYQIVIPAMALFFSENLNELKITFTFYFIFSGILQLFPQIITQKLGFRRAIYIYLLIFLIGTVVGYSYDGTFWIIALSRSLQAIGLSVLPILSKALTYNNPNKLKSLMVTRSILSALSGPLITIICGAILYFYSWRACYVLICSLYLLALIWFLFNLDEMNLGHDKTIKEQLAGLSFIIKQYAITSLTLSAVLCVSYSTMLHTIYGFIFIHDLHLSIYLVGFIPLLIGTANIIGVSSADYFKKKFSDVFTIAMSLLLLSGASIIFLLMLRLFPLSIEIILIPFLIFGFISGLSYMCLSEMQAKLAREQNAVVETNILYYFFRNFIPLGGVLVWTNFGKARHIDVVPEIFIALGVLSLLAFCVFLFLQRKSSLPT